MPARLDLDTKIARTLTDGVVSQAEVRDVAKDSAARENPQAVLDAYAGVATKLTSRAAEVVAAARTALTETDGVVKARDILLGTAEVKPMLPSWLPAGFNFEAAAGAMRAAFIDQRRDPESIGPGKAEKLIFSDFDLTLSKTSTPVYMRFKDTKKLFYTPEGQELLKLGIGAARDYEKEFDEAKVAHPSWPWDRLEPCFDDFNSGHDMARTDVIPDDVATLRKSDRDPMSRDYVITARSGAYTADFVSDYLKGHGIDLDGVVAVNIPETATSLGLDPLPSSSKRKAMAMAAIIKMYGPELVKEVSFMDETEKNQRAAMDLLPKLYPNIKFKFVDVIHTGNMEFKPHTIARTVKDGELAATTGKRLSQEEIAAYKSADLPIPTNPVFTRNPR